MATLNDRPEHCSTKYAGKVFHELFVKSSTGGRLGIPTVPLSEFYARLAGLFEASGGTLQLRASVEAIEQEPGGRWRVTASAAESKTEYTADAVVLALPFDQTRRLLPGLPMQDEGGMPLGAKIERFVHSPFTSILLWYDRQITDLDHAWLLDTTIEWFFHKSKIRGYAPEQGSYVEVVIAGSKAQLKMTREEILAQSLAELERFFPAVKQAKLLKSGVLKEAKATFSVTPGLDRYRPAQKTGWPGLYLAGDWTATEWPATMEGAVRSGRLAAGAVVGDSTRFMAKELAASGLMSLLGR
jgi:zeta-carotene desaturase